MLDFSTYSFRAHYIGLLMTDPKGKSNLQKYNETIQSLDKKILEYQNLSDKAIKTKQKLEIDIEHLEFDLKKLELIKDEPYLSQTCKTKLAEIYTQETTGRIKDIKSKYLEKGLLCEEDAITAYTLHTNEMYRKNHVREDNSFVNGELDLLTEDCVHDMKSSWDVFTFDANAFKKINPIYEWQGDVYMWLWNKEKFKLVYVLLNTPDHLIQGEIRKLKYEMFGNEANYDTASDEQKAIYKEACEKIKVNSVYDDLPPERKIRIFETKRSEERIEKLKYRIPMWRDYLNNFTKIDLNNETED